MPLLPARSGILVYACLRRRSVSSSEKRRGGNCPGPASMRRSWEERDLAASFFRWAFPPRFLRALPTDASLVANDFCHTSSHWFVDDSVDVDDDSPSLDENVRMAVARLG